MAAPARNADLEAAIVADPENPGGYLVYGDWLQVHGDPRGELIVIQHELETARGATWAKLKIRELELLTEHAGMFLGPAAAPHHWRNFDWRRGFIDRMRADFVTDEGEQLISHPSLAFVRALSNVEFPRIQEVTLPLLNELAVESKPRTVLAQSRLRHLALAGHASVFVDYGAQLVTTSGLQTFAFAGDLALIRDLEACQFPDLRVLQASWCFADDEGIDAMLSFLLSTPHAELDLTLCDEFSEGLPSIEGLGEQRVRRRIQALRLHDPDAATLRRLRTQLRRLKLLELTGIAAWSPALVAELPIAPRLSHLVLNGVLNNPETIASIAISPYAATIQHLKLKLGRSAGGALSRGVFASLRVLDVDVDLGLESSDVAAWNDTFPELEEIVLDSSALTAISESALAAKVQTLAVRVPSSILRYPRMLVPAIHRFRSLRVLRLIGHPDLAPAGIEALGALGVTIELAQNVAPVVQAV
jgi:uncharacterized protein (TIGR02996 family)